VKEEAAYQERYLLLMEDVRNAQTILFQIGSKDNVWRLIAE